MCLIHFYSEQSELRSYIFICVGPDKKPFFTSRSVNSQRAHLRLRYIPKRADIKGIETGQHDSTIEGGWCVADDYIKRSIKKIHFILAIVEACSRFLIQTLPPWSKYIKVSILKSSFFMID